MKNSNLFSIIIICSALLFSSGLEGTTGRANGTEPATNSKALGGEAGTITGVVRFGANYPKAERIRVSKDNAVCGSRVISETFIVSPETKGLKNMLITVEGISGKATDLATEITVEQKKCTYSPHFQVAQIGTEGIAINIINSDGVLHNVHAYNGKETLFNAAQPKFLKKITKKISSPGVVKLTCDVHNWMNAYIVLLSDKPYFAVTDENGSFEISGVPAGSYTLRAWHEALGVIEKSVEVVSGKNSTIDFIIQPKKRK